MANTNVNAGSDGPQKALRSPSARVTVLSRGRTRCISIDRKVIAFNRINRKALPVIVIEEDGQPERHARYVAIHGPSKVVYIPENREPGDDSPVAWVETESEISYA